MAIFSTVCPWLLCMVIAQHNASSSCCRTPGCFYRSDRHTSVVPGVQVPRLFARFSIPIARRRTPARLDSFPQQASRQRDVHTKREEDILQQALGGFLAAFSAYPEKCSSSTLSTGVPSPLACPHWWYDLRTQYLCRINVI